ncbi:hypothetical protein G3M48_004317, partial [Beauveria asiatica]
MHSQFWGLWLVNVLAPPSWTRPPGRTGASVPAPCCFSIDAAASTGEHVWVTARVVAATLAVDPVAPAATGGLLSRRLVRLGAHTGADLAAAGVIFP